MNFSKIFRTAAVAAAAIFTFGTAQAQSPDGQLGLGITTGGTIGGTVSYAINPAFHIGTQFGFQAFSPKEGNSSNTIIFAPYGRFLFAGPATFKPLIQAQFGYSSSNSSGVSASESALAVFGGAEYFVNRNLGIYGMISVLELGLSDQGTSFGLLSPQIGIEWFF
jgi:hypothetical protein